MLRTRGRRIFFASPEWVETKIAQCHSLKRASSANKPTDQLFRSTKTVGMSFLPVI